MLVRNEITNFGFDMPIALKELLDKGNTETKETKLKDFFHESVIMRCGATHYTSYIGIQKVG